MSNKIILPKDVCDALDNMLSESPYKSRPDYVIRDLYKSDGLYIMYPALYNVPSLLDLMQALVLGYIPELTMSEKMYILFEEPKVTNRYDYLEAYRKGMLDTLDTLGIEYDWTKDDFYSPRHN